jgi:ArsR family transcriptional regulator, lead/cadmium/zinc/bismuth-responsive transcriptional repressor
MQDKDLQRCTESSIFSPIGENSALRLSDFYKMFADSSRIKILYLLQNKEICVNHIAAALDMSISAVSHQLRLLRSAGLVRFLKEGKNSYYALDDDHVSDMLNLANRHIEHKDD